MELKVCIGEFCHLKGAERVIKGLQELCKNSKVEVTFTGCFCLGKCKEPGVTVQYMDKQYKVVCSEVEDFFHKVIVSKLG